MAKVVKVTLTDMRGEVGATLDLEISVRNGALVATSADGRMAALDLVGGTIRVMAWNAESEAPAILNLDTEGPVSMAEPDIPEDAKPDGKW
jgi:hypothetical protein